MSIPRIISEYNSNLSSEFKETKGEKWWLWGFGLLAATLLCLLAYFVAKYFINKNKKKSVKSSLVQSVNSCYNNCTNHSYDVSGTYEVLCMEECDKEASVKGCYYWCDENQNGSNN